MIYVSIDVETDGPCPGVNSMLSLGAVAFDEQGKEVAAYSANLLEIEGAKPDPNTMAWWGTQREAWRMAREGARPAGEVMPAFRRWLLSLPGRKVAVAYPAGFDFTFVYWYLHRFAGDCPLGFSCIDLKSYACAKLGLPFNETTKKRMPKRWFEGLPRHSHLAEDDAREQGMLWGKMRRDDE